MNAPGADYRRAKALYLGGVDLPPEQRRAWLDAECGTDAALRDAVDALFAADADERLSLGHDAPVQTPDAPPGYRLLRELGRGGMGVVWLAEREYTDYRQRVALKLLAVGGWRDPERHARFRAERRILASLDHPHVARLLDGGTLPDGTPYLAMEYVEGDRLDRWAERTRPPLSELLRVFITIARTVQAAHQRLVVHRDLKPANILIDPYGAPKLLDFGIAKLLDETADDTHVRTGTGMQPLTPRYAAPEQVRGEPAVTATDVHALGVILYELLTGRSPYGDASTTHDQLRAVCETDPVRPSAAARDGRAAPVAPARLRGDLDAIVMKCLRKSPDERYRGAGELADDLDAYLEGRPVHARTGSRRYALAKFAARHRTALLFTAAALAALIAFTVTLSQQLERTRQERDRAERTLQFAMGVFERADPRRSGGADMSVRDAVKLAAADLAAGAELPPAERAALLHVLAGARFALGEFDAARELLDEEIALRTRLSAGGIEHADALSLRGLTEIEVGQVEQGEAQLREAEAMLLRSVAADDTRLIQVALRRANAYRRQSRGADARMQFEQARALALRRLGVGTPPSSLRETGDRDAFLLLAASLHGLGVVAYDDGRFAEALSLLQHAVVMRRDAQSATAPETADSLNAIANVHGAQGRLVEAVATGREALAIRRAAYGDDHALVGQGMLNLAVHLRALKRLDEARDLNEGALAIFRRVYGETHAYTLIAMNNQALLLSAQGDVDAALQLHRTLYAQRRAALGANHDDVAQSAVNIGAVLVKLGRPAEAIAPLREGIAIYATHYSEPALAAEKISLAEALRDSGDIDAAERELLAVIAHEHAPDALPPVVALARFHLAQLRVERDGVSAESIALARTALAHAEAEADNEVLDRAEIERWLARYDTR